MRSSPLRTFYSLALVAPFLSSLTTCTPFLSRSASSSTNGTLNSSSVAILPLTNFGNQAYGVPISINGLEFLGQLDLGSSDLVADVEAQVPNATNLSLPVVNVFGIGEATGWLEQGKAVIGNFTIPDQTFTQYQTEQEIDFPEGMKGVLGIGPRFFSITYFNFAGTPLAFTVPDNIFAQLPPDSRHVLVIEHLRILSDDKGAVQTNGGAFGIGGVPANDALVEQIEKEPKLPISRDPASLIHQHWEVLLDADGITGADGLPIKTKSIFNTPGADPRQLRAFFDSGFTFPSVPPSVAEAFYSRVPGAQLNESSSYWTIPCTYELDNISFTFGGVRYPVHPLDMSVPYDIANQTLPNGTCMGTFQPSNFTANAAMGAGSYDIVMGMPFLRNVVFFLDFGNYTAVANRDGPDAFIQLLSTTTNATQAHEEFVQVRLGGNDTTASQPPLLPANSTQGGGQGTNSSTTSSAATTATSPSSSG